MHVSVLVPEPPVTLVGLTEQVSPVAGKTFVVNATESLRSLMGIMVMEEVTGTPGVVVVIAGFANIWKSTT